LRATPSPLSSAGRIRIRSPDDRAITNEIKAVDDKRFQIILKQPFRTMLFSLASRNIFVQPERIAGTPVGEQFKEVIGSGPYALPSAANSSAAAPTRCAIGSLAGTSNPSGWNGSTWPPPWRRRCAPTGLVTLSYTAMTTGGRNAATGSIRDS
jgi:hypothetical protein